MKQIDSRKKPIQDRGHKRLSQLLEAASELIAEVGISDLTTNAISARAKTSVGQIYKYFSNKEEIIEELSKQYSKGLENILQQRISEGVAKRTQLEAIEWTILSLVKFHETNPAFHHVYRYEKSKGLTHGNSLLDKSKGIIESLLEARSPKVKAKQRQLHSIIVVEAAHELIIYATSLKDPSLKRDIINEIIIIVSRYLDPLYNKSITIKRTEQ